MKNGEDGDVGTRGHEGDNGSTVQDVSGYNKMTLSAEAHSSVRDATFLRLALSVDLNNG